MFLLVSVLLEHANDKSSAEPQDVFGFTCRAFVCERRGERPEMQDAHIAIEDAAPTLQQLHRLHNEMHEYIWCFIMQFSGFYFAVGFC